MLQTGLGVRSAEFGGALLKHESSSGWRAVAVLPQPSDAAKSYMQLEHYAIAEVRQADLTLLGISATPTLLLVDERGKLVQEWIGLLSSAEEQDVAMHLGIGKLSVDEQEPTSTDPDHAGRSPILTTDQLLRMLKSNKKFKILDVRDELKFGHGHISGAVNIPLIQLQMRNPDMVLPNGSTILYCQFSPGCQFYGIPSLCSNATEALRRNGITDVRVIRDPIPILKEQGIGITGMADRP